MQAVDGEWSMRGRRLRPCCVVRAGCCRVIGSAAEQHGTRRRLWHKDKRTRPPPVSTQAGADAGTARRAGCCS